MFTYEIDEDVSLRLFHVADSEEFFQLTIQSKEYLREWLGWIDYTKKVEDSSEFIKSTLHGLVETGGYPKSVAILYQGKIAGTISFNEIYKTPRIGVIGYWLGEEFQGKGIMTKAFKAFIEYGFKELELNRIEVRAAVENKKSRALPERFGFIQEGTLRQAEWLYDRYVDHVVYGLLKEEWTQR